LSTQSLDSLLAKHVSERIGQRLAGTSTLSQIAQVVTNLEHFQVACTELERSLTSLRFVFNACTALSRLTVFYSSSAQRGGIIRLTASTSFAATLSRALERLTGLITSKLDDFFELSEYNWTPKTQEDAPSMYLYELVNWLTTVVDSLVIKDEYKDAAYKGAVSYIADCFMVGAHVFFQCL
jgi:exocyst complex component 6